MTKMWMSHAVTAAGLLVALLGIVRRVRWAKYPRALVQLIPTSAGMRRNAALGLVVCCLGLFPRANRRSPPALGEAPRALLGSDAG